MRISLEALKQVNPACEYYPPGLDEASYKQFLDDVMEFARQLAVEFTSPFRVDTSMQDSTHGAEISLPDHLIAGEGELIPCIRVSNHRKLYIVTVARRVSPATELRIEQVAEKLGFTYTPEKLFGEPFDSRDRTNGDLFNQLYDYV